MRVSWPKANILNRSKRPALMPFHIILDQDAYLEPLIREALSTCLSKQSFAYQRQVPEGLKVETPLLRIQQYENIDFAHHLQNPATSLANSYVIRKALIRKNHLLHTISSWWVKHPNDTTLKGRVPVTVDFELDYAEYLDEALAECWELHESFDKDEKEWWVLKPAMSDQGHGIRMFSSEAELRAIFEEWEDQSLDGDEFSEDGANTPVSVNGIDRVGAGTMTSQLRHFVAQRYIDKPLVFPEHDFRKFHIRSYVLAVGALKVYVYWDMLALFAPLTYSNPEEHKIDPRVHLTNTCLQAGGPVAGSVHRFQDLPDSPVGLPEHWKLRACHQIEEATSTLFEAAAREQMIHFQAIPNSFEVFGLDWLIDAAGNVWLLEVNAFPDFKQSGQNLSSLVGGFWKGTVRHAIAPFFGAPCPEEDDDEMIKVLDINLGRF